MQKWNNQRLEPVLITFNRAAHLESTLTAFLNAGLTSMRMHVLDNASSDATPEVVKKIQQQWPNLQYHRNFYNIGGNANILRALELSESEYHWCIGDDDAWFLENTLEFMEVLERNDSDIIRLGWQVSSASRGQRLPVTTLIANETMFFGSVSMISATVVRRSLMCQYLRQAYSQISYFYPQLIPIILSAAVPEVTVFSLKKDLMLHTPSSDPGSFVGDFEWYAVWYKTSLCFTSVKMRRRFNQETLHYINYISRNKKTRLPPWLFLIRLALTFKSLGVNQVRYLAEIFIYGAGVRCAYILPAVVYALTPSIIAKGLRELYRKLYRLPPKELQRDVTR